VPRLPEYERHRARILYLTFPSREAVKLEGEATHWDMVGDSGNTKTRGFCPACGSLSL